jgi:hypothetical protein
MEQNEDEGRAFATTTAQTTPRSPRLMNISLLIDGAAFDPEEVEVLSRCYEAVLQDLGLALREDPITLLVAERVIEFATRAQSEQASRAGLDVPQRLVGRPAAPGPSCASSKVGVRFLSATRRGGTVSSASRLARGVAGWSRHRAMMVRRRSSLTLRVIVTFGADVAGD